MSLWVDLYRLQEDLRDCQNRLDCLVECHLEEFPTDLLPDFVFPLQKVLRQALEEIQVLQQDLRSQVRPAVQQALQEMLVDPEHQELMVRLAESEAQDQQVAVARAEQAQKE